MSPFNVTEEFSLNQVPLVGVPCGSKLNRLIEDAGISSILKDLISVIAISVVTTARLRLE
jgi:hypothetical protein